MGRLVITLKAFLEPCDRRVRIVTGAGEVVWIELVDVERGKARFTIEAPLSVQVKRERLLIEEEARNPTEGKSDVEAKG